MATKNNDAAALDAIISILRELEDEERERVLSTVTTFFLKRVSGPIARPESAVTGSPTSVPAFSEDLSLTPKEFLLQKQPRTDVERVACLAYYLTHYRDMPHFKTLDLSKLNTDAAQRKFANAAFSAGNALKRGYLAAATKGHRQLSAAGEQFVRAMPDRVAAKQAMDGFRLKRKTTRKKKIRKPQSL